MDPLKSRGYRNKNPGNIDWHLNNKWQGQVGRETSGNPPRFVVFESHEYGIRALASLLITYQDRHGLRTVRGIINRWAPPKENITSAYVDTVARALGKSPDEPLNVHNYEHMKPLVTAIIRHELGGQPYSDATIDAGLRLAGVVKPVTTMRQAASTGTGTGAITVGAVASAAAACAPVVESLGGLSPWVGGLIVVVAALGAVGFVLAKRRGLV